MAQRLPEYAGAPSGFAAQYALTKMFDGSSRRSADGVKSVNTGHKELRMTTIREIQAKLCDGTIATFDVVVSDQMPWTLRFTTLGGTRRQLSALDLFEALREMRGEFERDGCLLLCAGARPDVAP